MGGVYKGVRVVDLHIDATLWTPERVQHLKGSRRRAGEKDIEAEWATEAALDLRRIATVAGSDSGDTAALKVVGWSESAGELLKVWIWSDDPHSPVWNGGSAAKANATDMRRYLEVEGDERRPDGRSAGSARED